jgi:hypothetical protein
MVDSSGVSGSLLGVLQINAGVDAAIESEVQHEP